MQEKEHLSSSDAYLFPIIGSVFLFSFYLIFKYLPKEYINYAITAYFSLFGTFSLSKLILRTLPTFLPSFQQKIDATFDKFHFLARKSSETILDVSFSFFDAAVLLVCGLISAYYAWSKNWVANNLIGMSFAITGITLIGLENFKVGFILLSGLFFYDIFWVFGTNVMVNVAMNFDAPIKMLFPRNIFSAERKFSILGLGDIVIPGIFIALCLKFDRHLQLKKASSKEAASIPAHMPYFKCAVAAYVAGLSVTMGVMHFFKAAQPALLYLSPACILSALGTALFRGELKEMFEFSVQPETESSSAKEAVVSETKKDQ